MSSRLGYLLPLHRVTFDLLNLELEGILFDSSLDMVQTLASAKLLLRRRLQLHDKGWARENCPVLSLLKLLQSTASDILAIRRSRGLYSLGLFLSRFRSPLDLFGLEVRERGCLSLLPWRVALWTQRKSQNQYTGKK